MPMLRGAILTAVVATCAGCGSQAPRAVNQEVAVNAIEARSTDQSVEAPQPGQPGGLPDDRNPVGEGAIDPKSAQGAAQVAQGYGALIEQRRFDEAAKLWSNPGDAARVLTYLQAYEYHLEVGAPGTSEGAAGSIFVTVPVVFYGKMVAGEAFRRPAKIILRRANDVPGSTEDQRRWHIERVDLQPPL